MVRKRRSPRTPPPTSVERLPASWREKRVAPDPPERWFSLFGLVVVRRTDLLAAAAFVLSASTAGYQLWGFARGANVTLYHPDTVYIYFDLYANGVTATRFAGEVSFINSGEIGQNAIVRDLSLTIDVGTIKFEEHWLSFAEISRKETTKIDVKPKESAHPLLVPGGSAAGQLVTFAASISECDNSLATANSCNETLNYVSDIAFLRELSSGHQIQLKFKGTLIGSKVVENSCTIRITEDMKLTLAGHDWYAAKCSNVPETPTSSFLSLINSYLPVAAFD
jgi:hypothetical protein